MKRYHDRHVPSEPATKSITPALILPARPFSPFDSVCCLSMPIDAAILSVVIVVYLLCKTRKNSARCDHVYFDNKTNLHTQHQSSNQCDTGDHAFCKAVYIGKEVAYLSASRVVVDKQTRFKKFLAALKIRRFFFLFFAEVLCECLLQDTVIFLFPSYLYQFSILFSRRNFQESP